MTVTYLDETVQKAYEKLTKDLLKHIVGIADAEAFLWQTEAVVIDCDTHWVILDFTEIELGGPEWIVDRINLILPRTDDEQTAWLTDEGLILLTVTSLQEICLH